MDPKIQKQSLRKEMKQLRSSCSPEKRALIDASIAQQLFTLPEWNEADTVFAYASMGDEVDTWPILAHTLEQGKQLVLPRAVSGTTDMTWHLVDDLSSLENSAFGIMEPPYSQDSCIDCAGHASLNCSIMLVPALAFDNRGYRLGYGGGYYDACLEQFHRVCPVSIGLVRESLLTPDPLPIESHDVAVNILVTENDCIRTPRSALPRL